MSLSYVILTVLSSREASGYDISKEFSHSLGYFWFASHQQIYRELIKMHNTNLVSCRNEPQVGKPDRKVYSITELGRKALQEWFQKPTRHPVNRDELSAKLMVCDIHSSEPMQQHIDAFLEESHSLLAHYSHIEHAQFTHHSHLDRQARIERLTLRRNVHNLRARIDWAKEVQAELKELNSYENGCSIAN